VLFGAAGVAAPRNPDPEEKDTIMPTKKATTKTKPATGKKTASAKQSARTKTPPAKTAAEAKPSTAKTGDKKLSALDAAAKVLGEAQEPLNAKTMIERMAAKGYWQSPGGQTPHATLYAAISREIQQKGQDARFQKADRGLFTLNK
jgi:hypothetical protein